MRTPCERRGARSPGGPLPERSLPAGLLSVRALRGRLLLALLLLSLPALVGACGGGGAGSLDVGGSTFAPPVGGGGGGGSPGGAGAPGVPDLGPGASLNGYRCLPDDNPWNQRVDALPVDPASDTLVASIGAADPLHPDFGASWNGGPFGIPYVVVGAGQPRVPVSFLYADESDPGPYPVPPDAPIEGGPAAGGDRHVLVLDRDAQRLYELFAAYPDGNGGWTGGSGAVFDLRSNALRTAGFTSADAAGLPILPGLVRYDEVAAGEIRHALRFTVSATRRAYVAPATHWASSSTNPSLPPMGMRVRLKASVNVGTFPAQARVVLVALQRYGMLLADNGSDWYLSGAPDSRWDDAQLDTLKTLRGSDFEVLPLGPLTTP